MEIQSPVFLGFRTIFYFRPTVSDGRIQFGIRLRERMFLFVGNEKKMHSFTVMIIRQFSSLKNTNCGSKPEGCTPSAPNKAFHWTRSGASSICLPSSRPVFVRCILLLSSRLLIGLPSGCLVRPSFIPKVGVSAWRIFVVFLGHCREILRCCLRPVVLNLCETAAR
jgi:hypothetical protein